MLFLHNVTLDNWCSRAFTTSKAGLLHQDIQEELSLNH